MATPDGFRVDVSFTAGSTLSGSDLYRFVRVDPQAAKRVRLANGASNPLAIGVLQTKPGGTGDAVGVAVWGSTQVYADATTPIGYFSYVVAGSDGQAKTQTGTSSSDMANGIALEALSSGSGVLIDILLLPAGLKIAAS